jgi:hypothetical protein
MDGGGKDASTGPKSIQSDRISNVSRVEGKLPEGLRLAGRNVPAADGMQVPLYLFRLPDGSDMKMVAVPAGDFSPPQGGSGRVDVAAAGAPPRVAVGPPCGTGTRRPSATNTSAFVFS